MLLSLFIVDQLEPGGSGLVSGAYLPLVVAASQVAVGGGELPGRLYVSGLAGRGEGLRRSHDETARGEQ